MPASGEAPAIPVPRRSKQGARILKPGKTVTATVRSEKKAKLGRNKVSAFQKRSTSQAKAIMDLLTKVTKFREQMDRTLFCTIFVRTLHDRLPPSELRRILAALRAQGIIPAGKEEKRPRRRGRPPKRKSSKKSSRLQTPEPLNLAWSSSGGPRRSPRLSPRTPVLASALMDLTRAFAEQAAGTTSEGFQIPKSPIVRTGGKRPQRPPPLPLPNLELGTTTQLVSGFAMRREYVVLR
uniref:Uncharacterized protein n=1 Tax=Lotharella globosa TaxID=91324 RepID=A0A7S4DHZ3_9EUKA